MNEENSSGWSFSRLRNQLDPDIVNHAIREYPPLLPPNETLIDEQRSLRNMHGDILLAVPSPRLMQMLASADSRISTFSYVIPPAYQTGHENSTTCTTIGEPEYNDFVSTPLAEQLAAEFPDLNQIVIRGVTCAVNGALYAQEHSILIRDIRQILQSGDDQARDGMNVGKVTIADGKMGLYYRVNQYLAGGHYMMRHDIGSLPGSEGIFPALLVLDKTKLTHMGGYNYKLPEASSGREKIIKRAIILPQVRK